MLHGESIESGEIAEKIATLTFTDIRTTPTGNLLGNNSYGGVGLIWNGNKYYGTEEFTSLSIFSSLRVGSALYNTNGFYVDFDTWIHIILTWNPTTHILRLYKDGVKYGEITTKLFSDGVSRALSLNNQFVYGGNGPSTSIPMYCNDIRVYDHCLSPKEVKLLSMILKEFQ